MSHYLVRYRLSPFWEKEKKRKERRNFHKLIRNLSSTLNNLHSFCHFLRCSIFVIEVVVLLMFFFCFCSFSILLLLLLLLFLLLLLLLMLLLLWWWWWFLLWGWLLNMLLRHCVVVLHCWGSLFYCCVLFILNKSLRRYGYFPSCINEGIISSLL